MNWALKELHIICTSTLTPYHGPTSTLYLFVLISFLPCGFPVGSFRKSPASNRVTSHQSTNRAIKRCNVLATQGCDKNNKKKLPYFLSLWLWGSTSSFAIAVNLCFVTFPTLYRGRCCQPRFFLSVTKLFSEAKLYKLLFPVPPRDR